MDEPREGSTYEPPALRDLGSVEQLTAGSTDDVKDV